MLEALEVLRQERRAGSRPQTPRAIVVVPTFLRPLMLAETLVSLACQVTVHPFAVVVVENDAVGRAGLATAERFIASHDLAGEAVVEPRQGNVEAINRGFAHALATYPDAEYILMLDDDEIASPGWLEKMIVAADCSGADIVGGPVVRLSVRLRPLG